MTIELMTPKLIRVLFFRFQAIYGDKWTARYNCEEIIHLAMNEWLDALLTAPVQPSFLKKVLPYLRDHFSHVPSIAEFLETYRLLKRRDREERETQERLEELRSVTPAQQTVAQENLRKIRDMLKNGVRTPVHPKHTTWDPLRYSRDSKNYDADYAQQRKHYICAMSETDALSLAKDECYDRCRYLSEQLAWNQTVWNSGAPKPAKKRSKNDFKRAASCDRD